MVDFGEGVRRQHCVLVPSAWSQARVIHKLRNVAKAVQAEEGMSRQEKRQRRKEVLQEARAVYAGQDRGEIEERLRGFDREWREREPSAVLALRRNFEATLAYLDIQAEVRQKGEE
jgi:transposase-like protein